MSYRFYLFEPGDGPDAVAAAHARLEALEHALVAGESERGAAPVWLGELRTVLGTRHPDLRQEAVATDAAWAPFAQYADPDDGVEIQLYGDSVSVTVPYWHSGERAEHMLLRVSDYLKTVRDVAGFVVYDPQLDRIVQLPGDLPRVNERYIHGTATLQQFAEQRLGPSQAAGNGRAAARRKPDEPPRNPNR